MSLLSRGETRNNGIHTFHQEQTLHFQLVSQVLQGIIKSDVDTPLLTTKLYTPPTRRTLVPRPHLLQRLDEGLGQGRNLTLVSAPAGFGKTTLLSEWIRGLDRPTAWVSLDDGDNDPANYLTYIIAAMQTVDEAIGESVQRLLEAPQPPPVESLVAMLINDISASPSSLLLVLDDYHLITEPVVHQAMELLIAQQPARVHIAIATRHDPPLPLPRMRARDQVTEIRQVDLRFTPEEAAAFLSQSIGLKLTSADIATLETHTEGWIAGLQLVALAVQGTVPIRGQDDESVKQLVAGFSGRHHFVLDYLTDEVLQQQPPDIQSFLLQTSILDRLSGPLCDAVVEIEAWRLETDNYTQSPVSSLSSRNILEHLESSNLFVIPLDDERRWYRYHRLFAELLQSRLPDKHPALVPELHRRAAMWHEEHGSASEAVRHALETQDAAWVASVIERAIQKTTTWSRLDGATFLSWLNKLPSDVVRARPQLQLFAARSHYVTGQWETTERILEDLELSLQDDPDAASMLDRVAADRASYAAVRGETSRAIAYARQALARLPKEDAQARVRPASILGLAALRAGDVKEAESAFSEAIAAARTAGLAFAAAPLFCNLAEVQTIQGRLRQAIRTCSQAVELGTVRGTPIHAVGFAGLAMGRILYEQSDLQNAERHILEGLDLVQQGRILLGQETLYATLALIRQGLGNNEGATEAIEQAIEIARSNSIPRLVTLVSAYQARIWLAQGHHRLASRWARDYRKVDQTEYLRMFEDPTLARVLLAESRPNEALALLETLLPPASTDGRMSHLIEILALRSLALQALDDTDGALDSLGQALEFGEPEGYVHVFVSEGERMAALLQQIASRSIAPAYVSQLLSTFDIPRTTGARAQPLPEPLTDRELEVLHLLAARLTNPEIAERLFISLPTVKSHTRNIYGKLGVHSRRQAVAQAKELGIL